MAVESREGLAAGFLVRDRVAAARAAVFRLAVDDPTRFDGAFLPLARLAGDERLAGCLRAAARFANDSSVAAGTPA